MKIILNVTGTPPPGIHASGEDCIFPQIHTTSGNVVSITDSVVYPVFVKLSGVLLTKFSQLILIITTCLERRNLQIRYHLRPLSTSRAEIGGVTGFGHLFPLFVGLTKKLHRLVVRFGVASLKIIHLGGVTAFGLLETEIAKVSLLRNILGDFCCSSLWSSLRHF